MTRYEHAQIGNFMICALFGTIVLLGIITMSGPASGLVVSGGISVLFLICLVLFYKLTIKIDSETLRASFGAGLICKTVRLADIANCEPFRIRLWDGWGIHLVPTPYGRGWLYNVSGWEAVAIKLRDGRRFALGTDDPHGLIEAIRLFASLK